MLNKMFRKMFNIDPMPLEVITAIQSILWGAWLVSPLKTFESSATYNVMRIVAPEEAWGILFIILGSAQLIVLHLSHWRWRGIMATITLAAWIFLDLGFWLSGSASAAPITYFTFVLAAAWSVAVLYGHKG